MQKNDSVDIEKAMKGTASHPSGQPSDLTCRRLIADAHACKELHRRSHRFALQNFQEVMGTEEFLLLPFKEVRRTVTRRMFRNFENLLASPLPPFLSGVPTPQGALLRLPLPCMATTQSDDQSNGGEMGGASRKYGRHEMCTQTFRVETRREVCLSTLSVVPAL